MLRSRQGSGVRRLSGHTGGTLSTDSDAGLSDTPDTNFVPYLTHKIQNQRSILVLAASEEKIFAGTQEGELLVCIESQV